MKRHVAKQLLAALPPRVIQRLSEFQALRTFHQAAASVPAYRYLLDSLGVPVKRIWSMDDFKRYVPIIDDNSYLRQFPVEMLCRGGCLTGTHMLEYSSDRSAAPDFWPREPAEDRHIEAHFECLFRDMFEAHRVATLVIVTWSHGPWLIGEGFVRTVRDLASSRRLKLTVVAPGPAIEQTHEVLGRFMGGFEQTVLVGRPALLERIVEQAARRGIRWPDHRVHLLCGPEGFPESWRERMAAALGIRRVEDRRAARLIACYAGAAPGIGAAAETPFALLLRRLTARDPNLCRDLFGSASPPAVFQYDPTRLWAEGVDGQLVLTYRGAVPLVRFNTHEAGDALGFERAEAILRDHGYDARCLLVSLGWPHRLHHRLPLLCVHGRPADSSVRVSRLKSAAAARSAGW